MNKPDDMTVTPIKMILHCPACGLQHIDDVETPYVRNGIVKMPAWTNPPHRSHLCKGCGHIWRPSDVATEGVKCITTRGKNDSVGGAYSPIAVFPEFRNLLTVHHYSDMSAIVQFVASRPAGEFVQQMRNRLARRKL